MVLKIIWLIILSILLVINTIFFVKDRKNYLNLLAAIFLTFAIIFSLHSIKKSQNMSAKVVLEKEVLGINMKCPSCGNTIRSDDNFCSECGKNLAEVNILEKRCK